MSLYSLNPVAEQSECASVLELVARHSHAVILDPQVAPVQEAKCSHQLSASHVHKAIVKLNPATCCGAWGPHMSDQQSEVDCMAVKVVRKFVGCDTVRSILCGHHSLRAREW